MQVPNEQHASGPHVARATLPLAMPPRAKPVTSAPKANVQTGLRLPQSILDELDEIAAELNAADEWKTVTKADLMRDAIKRLIDEHRAKKAGAPGLAKPAKK